MNIDSISKITSSVNGLGSTTQVEQAENGFVNVASGVASAASNAVLGPSFSEVLGNAVNQSINTIKSGENASFAGIQGTMSTREVVDAVMAADRSLQTAVAIRDKVVSAYLDLTKMQI